MLNANNEINIKKEERKHSWSIVFAWLYLKTIGRILPKRWNRWAENILYYDKATANNEVQTDAFKTVDESAQVDLKPEVAEKESQSEIMSKDGEVQTDRVTFQDMTIQTEYVEKASKNIEVDLKPETAEKESQSEIMSKDGGVQTDGVAFQHMVMQTECVEKIDKSVEVNLKSEVAEKESQRKLKDENEKLKGELEGANQVLKAFIGLCDDQAQQIANLQTGNDLLEEENGELKSKLAELEKIYRELAEVVDKRGEEFLAKLKERSETIVRLEGELIKLSAEFANKTRKLSVEGEEKDAKINSLTLLNEVLEQDKKAMQNKVDEQQQTISEFKSLTDKNEAVEKDNENLRMQIMRLEGKVSELEGKISDLGCEKEALQSNVNTLTAQLQSVQESKQQLEEEKSNIEQQKQAELEQTICKNAELEIKVSELRKEKAQFEEQLEAMKEERKTYEENQRKLESRLSTAINKKKNLENDVAELQKQVQTLEGNKEWELAGIDGTLKETFLTIMELLAQQLLLNNQEQSVKEKKLEELTLSYVDREHQIEELQLENDFLEEQNGELRSRNRKLKSEVVNLKEESIQSKVELASGIVKGLEDSERKCMKTGSLTLLDEELSASVEKLSDQLYKVRSIERQQPQNTQGSKQQLEIDLEGKLKDLSSQLSTAVNEKKDLEDKVSELQEQKQILKENKENVQQGKANMKLAAKSEVLRKTKTDLSQQNKALQVQLNREKNEVKRQKGIIFKKDNEIKKLKEEKGRLGEELQEKNQGVAEQKGLVEQLQKKQKQTEGQLKADTKKLQEAKEGQLAKKAGTVSLDSKYNEKYIKSYTGSLPLKDEVKTKYTPNSFLSHTSSTASINSLNVRVSS